MKNLRKLKTENKVYNEAYNDGNFDVQSNRQATGLNSSLSYNDRKSSLSKKVFGIDIAVIHTGT